MNNQNTTTPAPATTASTPAKDQADVKPAETSKVEPAPAKAEAIPAKV